MRKLGRWLVLWSFACTWVACSGQDGDELEGPDSGRQGQVDEGEGPERDGGHDASAPVTPMDAAQDPTPDSGGPEPLGVILSAAPVPATTDSYLLSAAVSGPGISSVAFYEGDNLLGTDTTAPYEQPRSFTFLENGPHTFTALVTGEGGQVTSLPLTLTVAVPPNGYFVNPTSGDDTLHDGSEAAPFKTLQKAAQVTTDGQTVYLQDGEYNPTNQPTFAVSFKPGVHVLGMSDTGVVFKATDTTNQIDFSNGGSLDNVQFDTFNQALAVRGSGTFAMRNVQFKNVATAMFVQNSVQATIDGTVRPIFVAARGSSNLLWTEGTSQTHFKGDVSDLQNPQGYVFFSRGGSTLTIEDSTFRNIDRSIFIGNDNSHLIMRRVVMDDIAWPGQGPTLQAVLSTGGQNTENPLDYSIDLEDSTIENSALSGIFVSLYASKATKGHIGLTRSNIQSNAGYGIRVISAGSTSFAGLDLRVDLAASAIKGNLEHGIYAENSHVFVKAGEISGNGRPATTANGIQLSGTGFQNSLWVRGTLISGNGPGHGISFDGSAASSLDLGDAGNLGGIIFSNVSASHAAVSLLAPIQALALGNTWLPGVQGADPSGNYTGAVTIPASTTGQNVTTGVGASVVVSQ